jgi:penicillin-binding protein 1A
MELHVALSKRLRGIVRVNEPKPIYKVGHVLALRFGGFVDETPLFVPDNDPQLQGALVAIENRTGYVRALVGGATGEHYQFNRATQGRRQPGSAFKPIIYSVALEEKSYSPATIIVDEQIEVELDEKEEEIWEPRNAGGNFLGPLSLRRALELSRNICTIKILMDVGFDPVIEMARNMGITSRLGRNLSLSLGTSEVSLFQLTSAFTVFPNSGIRVEPVLVKRIEDRYGNVLEDNTEIPLLDDSEIPRPVPREEFRTAEDGSMPTSEPANPRARQRNDRPKQKAPEDLAPAEGTSTQPSKRVSAAMSPQTAYIMTSILQGGVKVGTGARMVKYVQRRDLAGKTGTTNNAEDTWFVGFSPEFTAGVWVGFDEKRPLGSREEGARAALPVWGYFMAEVLKNRPERDFPVPPDVSFTEMLTFAGSPSEGFSPKPVREPVYTPFAGKTLVLCPIDTPETLAAYRLPFPGLPAGQTPYGYHSRSASTARTFTRELQFRHPMDGRNLFPEQGPPLQGAPPGQPEGPPRGPSGDLNVGPPAQTGYLSDSEAPVRPSMGNPQPARRGLNQPHQQNLNSREDPRSFQQPNPNPYSYQAPATRGPQ